MSLPDRVMAAARSGAAHTDSPFEAGALRLRLYLGALLIAFTLDLLVEGPGAGLGFWILGALCLAGLASSLLGIQRLLRPASVGALVLALAVPLGPLMLQGLPVDSILTLAPPWPQTLVALLASRVLAEECDLRFARIWRNPLTSRGPLQSQSGLAALALGSFFTLLFYQTIWWLVPARPHDTSFSAIVLNALTGETIIHRSIILLFFVIVGFLVDSALLLHRDRTALQQLRRWAGREGTRPGLGPLREELGRRFDGLTHLRAVRLVTEAADRIEGRDTGGCLLSERAYAALQAGTRRYIRGLLPFLPMLGFFGTVVGLATAMAALPTTSPEGGGVDISNSLSGLAVKFQTTLLGIMASLIASAVLSWLDKRETELDSECALFVASVAAMPGAADDP